LLIKNKLFASPKSSPKERTQVSTLSFGEGRVRQMAIKNKKT